MSRALSVVTLSLHHVCTQQPGTATAPSALYSVAYSSTRSFRYIPAPYRRTLPKPYTYRIVSIVRTRAHCTNAEMRHAAARARRTLVRRDTY